MESRKKILEKNPPAGPGIEPLPLQGPEIQVSEPLADGKLVKLSVETLLLNRKEIFWYH